MWTVVAVLALGLLPACGSGAPRISRSSEEPSPTTTSPTTTSPTTTGPAPRPRSTAPAPAPEPAELRIGTIDFDRPATGTVLVRPGRRPVTFGRTELRGSAAYDLTADTCSGQRLLPTAEGCRLEVTVLSRATGEVAAKLVLPYAAGPGAPTAAVSVPVTATVPLTYTVTITVLGGGTVTGDRAGISCSGTCTARVTQRSTLTLTGSAPARWGGDCATAGVGTACRLTVDTPLAVSADFR